MRLLQTQIETINELTGCYLGNEYTAYLFGSRLNDDSRGGDVDLLVETAKAVPFPDRARLKAALERNLRLPVDIVFACGAQSPPSFVSMIRKQAVRLPKGVGHESNNCRV